MVSTALSGIPELVVNEKTGLLVPPGKPDELAEAMLRMLTDVELRSRIIAAAGHCVVEDFYNRQLIQDLAGVYRHAGFVQRTDQR